MFSFLWVAILFTVLSTLIRPRAPQALLMQYARNQEWQGCLPAYHAHPLLWCGWKLCCHIYLGKIDPAAMFGEKRTMLMHYSRIPPEEIPNDMVASAAIDPIRKNVQCRKLVQKQNIPWQHVLWRLWGPGQVLPHWACMPYISWRLPCTGCCGHYYCNWYSLNKWWRLIYTHIPFVRDILSFTGSGRTLHWRLAHVRAIPMARKKSIRGRSWLAERNVYAGGCGEIGMTTQYAGLGILGLMVIYVGITAMWAPSICAASSASRDWKII